MKKVFLFIVFLPLMLQARPLDIMLSIDNSTSMDIYSWRIPSNIIDFVERLDEAKFDYRFVVLKGNDTRFGNYTSLPYGPFGVVNSSDNDRFMKISKNVQAVLTSSQGMRERPFLTLLDASKNESLFREGSLKVLISLSDFVDLWDSYDVSFYSRYLNSKWASSWLYIPVGSPARSSCLNAEKVSHAFMEQMAIQSGGAMERICDDFAESVFNTLLAQ